MFVGSVELLGRLGLSNMRCNRDMFDNMYTREWHSDSCSTAPCSTAFATGAVLLLLLRVCLLVGHYYHNDYDYDYDAAQFSAGLDLLGM